jgi:hypothetical protein
LLFAFRVDSSIISAAMTSASRFNRLMYATLAATIDDYSIDINKVTTGPNLADVSGIFSLANSELLGPLDIFTGVAVMRTFGCSTSGPVYC